MITPALDCVKDSTTGDAVLPVGYSCLLQGEELRKGCTHRKSCLQQACLSQEVQLAAHLAPLF